MALEARKIEGTGLETPVLNKNNRVTAEHLPHIPVANDHFPTVTPVMDLGSVSDFIGAYGQETINVANDIIDGASNHRAWIGTTIAGIVGWNTIIKPFIVRPLMKGMKWVKEDFFGLR